MKSHRRKVIASPQVMSVMKQAVVNVEHVMKSGLLAEFWR